MEIYEAFRQEDYDTLTDSSTLFWGASILIALVASCLLASKGIKWLRNRRKFDDAAAEGGHHRDPEDPWVHSISSAFPDHDGAALVQSRDYGAAMNQREQQEIFSAARKARNEMQRRRTAREQAQKTQSDS